LDYGLAQQSNPLSVGRRSSDYHVLVSDLSFDGCSVFGVNESIKKEGNNNCFQIATDGERVRAHKNSREVLIVTNEPTT
jgi:hypothetical protein